MDSSSGLAQLIAHLASQAGRLDPFQQGLLAEALVKHFFDRLQYFPGFKDREGLMKQLERSRASSSQIHAYVRPLREKEKFLRVSDLENIPYMDDQEPESRHEEAHELLLSQSGSWVCHGAVWLKAGGLQGFSHGFEVINKEHFKQLLVANEGLIAHIAEVLLGMVSEAKKRDIARLEEHIADELLVGLAAATVGVFGSESPA